MKLTFEWPNQIIFLEGTRTFSRERFHCSEFYQFYSQEKIKRARGVCPTKSSFSLHYVIRMDLSKFLKYLSFNPCYIQLRVRPLIRKYIYFNVKMCNMMKKEVNSQPIHLYKSNELLFLISSIIFNLAVSGVYISSKIDSSVLLKIFGGIVVLLIIPFTISLVRYVKAKAKKKIIISHIFILFYLLLEVLLDYILKIPFRQILVIHIPYIIVFYAAAFSMIGVSRTISRKMGLLVIARMFG